MEVIVGGRQSGKTTKLIERCASTVCSRIVVRTHQEKEFVMDLARKMGKSIPRPVTYEEVDRRSLSGGMVDALLLDNADLFLQSLFPRYRIAAVTMTDEQAILTRFPADLRIEPGDTVAVRTSDGYIYTGLWVESWTSVLNMIVLRDVHFVYSDEAGELRGTMDHIFIGTGSIARMQKQ